MAELRVLASAIVFALSAYLVYDLFTAGFDWATLAFCVSGFVVAHLLWPRSAAHESHWYDIFEIVIDLPYRSVALFLRTLGRLCRGGDGGVDLDL